MHISIHPDASEELNEASLYYEAIQPGLGKKFVIEYEKSLDLIESFPYGWRIIGGKTRRINIKRFPYLVLYIIFNDEIALITCIAHSHRDPEYYMSKIL